MGIVFRTARKIYRCWRCGKTILKGVEYARDKSSEATYCESCGHIVIEEQIRFSKNFPKQILSLFVGCGIAWIILSMLGFTTSVYAVIAVILAPFLGFCISLILNAIFIE